MKTLLVIDLQEGLLSLKDLTPMLETLEKTIIKFEENGDQVVFIRNISDDPENIFYPEKVSSEIYKPFQKYADKVVNKKTPSSFYQTNLDNLLKESNSNEIYITGLNSEYCVTFTTVASFDRGYQTVIIEDLVDTVNAGKIYGYKSLDITDYTLTVFFNSGVIELIESTDIE